MNSLDYIILAAYLFGLLSMGFYLRQQSSKHDYFLGGRSIGWKPLSLSVMATQLSAISFVSAPAFVGLREGGGLVWLSYELAVPLAMLFLLWRLLPTLHQSGGISVYDFLEKRFDTSSRLLISVVFQISRSFATGIMIYAIAIILQGTIGFALWESIALIGIVTIIYSLQGGMSAVVYGDAVQMILIVLGTIICLVVGLQYTGGLKEVLSNVEADRLNVFNTQSSGFDGRGFGLIPMFFGGLILYAAYYGCDQSEAQRSLSASSTQDLKKMLMAAAFMRFPITVLHCLTGLVIGSIALTSPEFFNQIPADNPDWMMPIFIINYLPNGLIGFLLVAILAAAMSSLSSAVNSLSAVSVEDFCRLTGIQLTPSQYLSGARAAGIFWAGVTLALSFFAGDIAPTVIEAINKIGSVFYGPILGCFVLAVYSKSIQSIHVNLGIASGVTTNIVLWLFFDQIFWFWWNVFGFLVTVMVSYVVMMVIGSIHKHSAFSKQKALTIDVQTPLSSVNVIALMAWFLVIIGTSILISKY